MSKKIVFMGTPEFAVPTLEALKNSNNEIVVVYSQPASKANRGQKLLDSKVGSLAKKFSLSLRTPKTLESDLEFKFFSSLKPDIVVVVAYGQLIPRRFLDIPKLSELIKKNTGLFILALSVSKNVPLIIVSPRFDLSLSQRPWLEIEIE